MGRFIGRVLVAAVVAGLGSPARAGGDEKAKAILARAIKALGGEENLEKITAYTVKSAGTIRFGGSSNYSFTSKATVQGLDKIRSDFEGHFDGKRLKGITVLAGDKGWHKFAGKDRNMDHDGVATEKRNVYLQVVPGTLVPLKGRGFKVCSGGQARLAGKPADILKVTGPDGKDFELFIDRKSGLPVKLVAHFVGYKGEEFTIETTYADYRRFGAIRKATRFVTTRAGEPYLEQEVTEFRLLAHVDPLTFAEPQ
jgi:hypothetical protein